MDVIELRNPRALLLPDVQALLRRAIASGALVNPGPFDSLAKDFFDMVTDDNQIMLLGAENGEFHSVVMVYLPVGNLFPHPTVPLFYNEGSRQLLQATKDKLLDTLVARGYTRMLAANSSGHSDKAWMKGLTPEGATSRPVGTLVLFEVE